MVVNDFPFEEETIGKNIFIRKFENVKEEELVWHRDKEDRTVEPIETSEWMLQFENKLPEILEKGKKYFIPKNTYHRVIKGNGTLVINLIKHF